MKKIDKRFDVSSEVVVPASNEIHIVKQVWKPLSKYVSRPEIIEKIIKIFPKNMNYVFISGIGGSGKSELIKKYVDTYGERYSGNICMLEYHGNIRETINSGLHFWTAYCNSHQLEQNWDKLSRQEIFLKKINMLNEVDKSLIVIDDFENFDDENMHNLLNCNADIIILTREWNYNYENIIDITNCLAEEEEKQLFKNYYQGNDLDDKTIKKLCNISERHPLTIVLLAKLVSLKKYNLSVIFEKFSSYRKFEFKDPIIIEKDRNLYNRNIFEHLANIIEMFGLLKQQKQILFNISLACPCFFEEKNFIGTEDDLHVLQKLNLINIINNKIQIHPLVAESILNIMKVDLCGYKRFFYLFYNSFMPDKASEYYLSVVAYKISVYIKEYDSEFESFFIKSAEYFFSQSEYNKSYIIYKYIHEYVSDELKYAKVNYQIGKCLKYLGNYAESIEIYLHIQKICLANKNSIPFQKIFILVLIGIANNYHMLGEQAENKKEKTSYFSSAIDFYKKALHISKGVNGKRSINCASIYDNLALMYANIWQFEHAYTNSVLSRKIFISRYEKDSQEVALCYVNLGEICKLNNKFPEALRAYKISEQIKEKVLPPDHISHAVTFINIAQMCTEMGQLDEAKKYYLLAQNITSMKLSGTHIYNKHINNGLSIINSRLE